MRSPTQRQRVLGALRRTGPRGLTAVDFLAPRVIDGGPPITRLASRIDELRQDGHRITSSGRRQRCVIYRLGEPEPPEAPAVEARAAPGADTAAALFEPERPAPASPYDAWEDGR